MEAPEGEEQEMKTKEKKTEECLLVLANKFKNILIHIILIII